MRYRAARVLERPCEAVVNYGLLSYVSWGAILEAQAVGMSRRLYPTAAARRSDERAHRYGVRKGHGAGAETGAMWWVSKLLSAVKAWYGL